LSYFVTLSLQKKKILQIYSTWVSPARTTLKTKSLGNIKIIHPQRTKKAPLRRF